MRYRVHLSIKRLYQARYERPQLIHPVRLIAALERCTALVEPNTSATLGSMQ